MTRHLSLFLLVLFVVSTAPLATSYIMVSDSQLVEQADYIVTGRIAAVSSKLRAGLPETVYTLEVDGAWKGDAPARLEFCVAGGSAEGVNWLVSGMPRYEVGHRGLLFLTATKHGDLAPVHSMLGAFHDVDGGRERLAVRNLADARELRWGSAASERFHQPRNLDRFLDWIEASVASESPAEDYFALPDSEGARQALESFTLLGGLSPPVRWFKFDQSQSEDWRINENGQPGFDAEGGAAPGSQAFRDSMNAWNDDPNSNIDYRLVGETAINDPGTAPNPPPFSLMVFDDPTDRISSNFTCSQNGFGGVLGQGGPIFSGSTQMFKGQPFHPSLVATVIMNDNVECMLASNGGFFSQAVYETNIAEVFTHELGHTLAIGHSCGDSISPPCNSDPTLNLATMNATAAFDGRGASIMADDRAAIAFLYGASAGGPGDSSSYFAQVGDLDFPGFVKLQTALLIANTTNQAATATLSFFGAGNFNEATSTVEATGPVNMPFNGLPLASSYELNLSPGEVRVLETPGTSPLASFPLGFGQLTAPDGVTGTAVFIRTNAAGVRNTKAGVPAIGLGTDASLIVDNRGTSNTGFVLVNPPDGGGLSAQADANVTLRLYDANFNLRETVNLTLEAGAHFSRFLGEVFTQTDVSNFLGSLTLVSSSPMTALELLEDDPPGDFPANIAILTAFPVNPGRADQTLVAGSARLVGRRLETRVGVPSGIEALAAVYRIYDGDTQLARIVRDGGEGELRESFRLATFADASDLRVSVQFLRADREPTTEFFLEN